MPRSPALFVLLALCGCRHVPESTETGASSFAIVRPPPVPAPANSGTVSEAEPSGAQYREAFLAGKPVLPIYPPRALKERAGSAQVGVRVTIDSAGTVTDVSPSLFAVSVVPAAFAEEFKQAVDTAVRQWKFRPASIEYVETVSGGGITYERVTRSEKLETTLDLSFTFTANGKVTAPK